MTVDAQVPILQAWLPLEEHQEPLWEDINSIPEALFAQTSVCQQDKLKEQGGGRGAGSPSWRSPGANL
eukprot:7624040-Ditylum_brightwellii.AAC.1